MGSHNCHCLINIHCFDMLSHRLYLKFNEDSTSYRLLHNRILKLELLLCLSTVNSQNNRIYHIKIFYNYKNRDIQNHQVDLNHNLARYTPPYIYIHLTDTLHNYTPYYTTLHRMTIILYNHNYLLLNILAYSYILSIGHI